MQVKHRMQLQVGKTYFLVDGSMMDPKSYEVVPLVFKGVTAHWLLPAKAVLEFETAHETRQQHFDQDIGIGFSQHNLRQVFTRKDEAEAYANRINNGELTDKEADLVLEHMQFVEGMDGWPTWDDIPPMSATGVYLDQHGETKDISELDLGGIAMQAAANATGRIGDDLNEFLKINK